MAKVRFTEEQIADFLQQSKNGVPDKVLCERFEFSVSTLRRWRELHAAGVREELKQLESGATTVFIGFILSIFIIGAFSKAVGIFAILFFMLYCVSYIRRFRLVSAKHIKEADEFLSRSGRGAGNTFYQLSWAVICFAIIITGYGILNLF